MSPLGNAKGNKIKDGCHATYKDMHGMGKFCALFNYTWHKKTDQDPCYGKRYDYPGLFQYANMKVHLCPKDAAAQIRQQDIAHAADRNRSQKADEQRLYKASLVFPEHGRSNNST